MFRQGSWFRGGKQHTKVTEQGSARQGWSQNFPPEPDFPPCVLTVQRGGPPCRPPPRQPEAPQWSSLGSPHPDPDGWCPGWWGSLHTGHSLTLSLLRREQPKSTSLLTGGSCGAWTHHEAAELFCHQKGHEPVGEDTDAGGHALDMQREDLRHEEPGDGPPAHSEACGNKTVSAPQGPAPRLPADPGAEAWLHCPRGPRGLDARLGSASAPSCCEVVGQALCFLHSE